MGGASVKSSVSPSTPVCMMAGRTSGSPFIRVPEPQECALWVGMWDNSGLEPEPIKAHGGHLQSSEKTPLL